MKNGFVFPAHGGCGLINRVVPHIERNHFIDKVRENKVYRISNADLSTFYRIADGMLSPLEGPMDETEFYRVLDDEVIERNSKLYAWTIPLAFSISREESDKFSAGETVAVMNEHGAIVGALEISDIYPLDKARYNKAVYGSDRKDHPGPRIVNEDSRDYLLGGKIWAITPEPHAVYSKYMLSPEETRALFKERKWERTVAFQTRNPLHRAHEYTMVYAMETLTEQGFFTGVVLNPLTGQTKKDDVPADIRMRTYEILINNKLIGQGDKNDEFWQKTGYDLCDNAVLIGMDIKMFYAGPKEAIMHAVYRQNLGFTDIIIGRRHADAPFDDGTQVWGDFDAQQKFDELNGELLIQPVKVGFAAYYEELGKVDLMINQKDKGYTVVSIAGKDLRKKPLNGEPIDERVMRKPVADILSDFYQARIEKAKAEEKIANLTWHDLKITKQHREEVNRHKAAVMWLTGLSGSGKSTIAVELQNRLFKRGVNVYVLDGDNVRHGLNRNLGFSPPDRKENIRRIGEVAKLFADAGTLVVTSFISPYAEDRDVVRNSLEKGDFVEVFVKTSLEECEHRDTKGLYKKARAGEIKDFTGISAPYEEPDTPEIIVNTEKETKEESAEYIIQWLEDKGYIRKKVIS
ncbi:MAG: adenylyl-sulfate kinase [Candidatus Aegiribacteria sp.]|nr:adenylyl-sulfate kinase [Candidatus Aegiribacteria sp.]